MISQNVVEATGISLLIISLVVCYGLLLQFFVYYKALLLPVTTLKVKGAFTLPGLISIPVAIFAFHYLFDLSLIFPVFLTSTFAEIIVHALIPSLLLGLASGFYAQIKNQTLLKLDQVKNSCFLLMVKGYGKSKFRQLFPLIVPPVFIEALSGSIVVLIAELIVVEALFNIPGLASLFWKYSKAQNVSGIIEILLVGAVVVCLPILAQGAYNKKMAKRLEAC